MRRLRMVCGLVLALGAINAFALTDEEIFRDFRFNLINPGARSLALGGAFVSLADDATAAQANPSGLAFLLRPEYFAEVRAVDNAAESSIRRESLQTGINTFVATGTSLDDTVSPSFVSVVTTYGKWAMGLSRQELFNIENTTLSSFAFTFDDSPGVFLTEGTGNIDVDVTNINVSAGVQVADGFGIGATLTYSTLDMRSRVTNLIVDTGANVADMEILEPALDVETTIDDDDDDIVFSLGLIYKASEKWGVGGVFRKGPDFSVPQYIRLGEDVFNIEMRLGDGFLNRVHLPDVYGVGGHWRPNDRFTIALDAERILYSNLLDDYIVGVNILTGRDGRFKIDDATDVRLGAEYVLDDFRGLPPLALRGGAFTESDSTIRASTTGAAAFATKDFFQGRDRQVHGAIGLGVVLRNYKIDLAADFSESDNEYLVSFIYKGRGTRQP